ncbi:MAG TPA: 50S ribosomal protein L32 [Thermoflexales bacterium]|nr:50S ribosomal protein L32 [Thermoflexales bacterium]HQW36219.1 50S ribosomal protein L32 [Thermoflexales bacterium]HQZ22450.1 50S ribosomal protein L32 [Thermoflexales bacterium]
MGPLPKRKFSWGRTHRRRAHDALTPVQLVKCPECGEMKPPHLVCPNCGKYKGRQVVAVSSPDEGKEDKK